MDENRNNQNNQETTGQSTGNGNYEYGQNSQSEYRSSYSNSYGSNQQSAGGWNSNQNNKRPKKGKGGKVALAVLLAAIFGVCAGLGGYGISRASRNGALDRMTTEASADDSEEEAKSNSDEQDEDAEDSGEKEDSKDTSAADTEANGGELNLVTGDEINTKVTEVVKEAMPSIVSVYNNFTQTSRDFFGQTYEQEGTSTGSGIIIGKTDDELLIVTNNHVVEDEDSLEVQFIDETTADANVKGTDESNDLAVIAVDLDDIDSDTMDQIKVATLGDSDSLQVGEPVVAIGNALGYGQSVTTGVVSALNREIQSQDSETGDQINGTFIQTDAAINPGNSGGALLDLNGNVIGINSSKIGGSTVDGMGFAIPMSKAAPIIEDLMNQTTKTKVSEDDKGYLGITGVSVTSQVSSAYNMPQGVYVYDIIDGGGAADSNLKKGDIITGIEGSTITTMEELQKQLEYYAAGQTITLTVERASSNGEYEEKSIDVTLGDASTLENAENSQSGSGRSSQSRRQDSGEQNGSDQNESSGKGSSADQDNEDSQSSSSASSEESGSSNSGDGFNFYTFPWNQW